MISRGQEFINTLREIKQSAIELAFDEHNRQQVATIIRDIGAELELYLKESVYSGNAGRNGLSILISGLASKGVSQAVIDELDGFRKNFYNKSKHDHTFNPSTAIIIEKVNSIFDAVKELVELNLGDSGKPSGVNARRLFWIGAWDHYIGGDTEIHIVLPVHGVWLPPSVDMIYIDLLSWENVKNELSQCGDLSLGKGTIPDDHFDSWAAEGDFLDGGYFEGSYKDLISILAKYERVEDILPDLKRENHPSSMKAAALFAAVDASQEGKLSIDGEDEIKNVIIKFANNRYAAPCNSRLLSHL